ncbi:metallophosphoesterase [Spirosoma spitsbergense]|uniref:metallophosphoesterase n=1 Tax=Spirosoma spitsbergense TaxID=431554 RepID=UPI0003A96FBE|nr:metallophosphoesterase [Spirosoma spitsbergense]
MFPANRRPIRFWCSATIALFLFVTLAGCHSAATDPALAAFPDDVMVKPLPNALTFFAFGDWGVYGLGDQTLVAGRMDRYAQYIKPSFITLLGDNFYPAGVASTTDAHWTQSFGNVYKGTYLPQKFYAVLGNHDYQQNTQAEIDYSKVNPRWVMPARYYTQVYPIDGTNKLRIVYLDTSPFLAEYRNNPGTFPDITAQNTTRQLAWVDSVLSQATERWIVVMGHHPVYSVGQDHASQPELVQQLQPLLAKYNVALYLNGHSHTLQYLRPAGSATDYVIAGGGGAPLAPPPVQNPVALFAQSAYGFAVISANATNLAVSLVDEEGKLLYQMQR